MNIESSTKEYAVTSVRCALTVAALSALLYGITTYHQTLTSGLHAMVLGIVSGAVGHYATVDNLGFFVCFILPLKVVPLLSEMGGLTFFVGLSLALIIKSITERDWYDQFDERQLLKTQVQPEAAEVV